MPKVSVIVPVYGVEKYIERCARSLFEQTLNDIEYLFIDDCTPDKSIEILNNVLEEYPHRKKQVIIHRMEKNSGQAAVRKWGMLNATGDYVIHCDSDDWVDVTMYEKMYNKAIEEGSDVVVCDFCRSDGINYSQTVDSCFTNDIHTFLIEILYHKSTPSSCNKLIKRSVYNNSELKYPIYPMAEDLTMISQIIYYCKSLSYIQEPLYVYYENQNSISNSLGEKQILKRFNDSIANMSLLLDFFSKDNVDESVHIAFCTAIMHQKDRLLPLIGQNKYYELWTNTLPQVNKTLLMSRFVPIKDKLRIIIVQLRLYPLVRTFLNRLYPLE